MLEKLKNFNEEFGPSFLLQPNRFEYADGFKAKCYIECTKQSGRKYESRNGFQFEEPDNPHAGCSFLDRKQMDKMVMSGLLGKRYGGWVSPLDSSATYAIMNTFRIVKPALKNPSYFQAEHYTKCMTEYPFELYTELTMEPEEWKPRFKGTGVYIWGVSGRFDRYYRLNADIPVVDLIDGKKEEKELNGKVYKIRKPLDFSKFDVPVIITSTYVDEIRQQLCGKEAPEIYFWQRRENRLTDISNYDHFEQIRKKLFIE